MPAHHFKATIGGVVVLDCQIRLKFGMPEAHTLEVYFNKKPFVCGGILMDFENEIVPLTDVLLVLAERSM